MNASQQTFVLEDVLKTSFVFVFRRRLDQDEYIHLTHTSSYGVFKTSSRRFQDVLPRRLQDVFKTSSTHLARTFSRPLQNVFKTSCKTIFKTSTRRFEDVYKTFWRRWGRLQDTFMTSSKRVFKTTSRRITELICFCWRVFKMSLRCFQNISQT